MKRGQADQGTKHGANASSADTNNNNKTNKYGRFLRDEPKQRSLLIATTRPPAATSSGMGGTLSLLDLQTGAVQASTRLQGGDLQHSKQQLGILSLSLFPSPPDMLQTSGTMAIAYGVNEKKENDAFAILLTIRNSDQLGSQQNQPPVAHWRCRLPEHMSAGLLVSPVTSRHIVGAGASGGLYVWDVWNQGNIIRTAPNVHYRAISCMIWSTPVESEQTVVSPWDCHLITGGADGMVHVFTHADLVEDAEGAPQPLTPVRTWSKHHLAVKALVALEGGRFASSGDDGLVLVMDIVSKSALLSIQLPNGIHALAHNEGCLLAGSIKGTIHRINIDEYAAERAKERGGVLMQKEASGMKLKELKGHNRPVSALAILGEDEFISGDEGGVLRVWDHDTCVRVIQPWNHGGSATTETPSSSSSSRGSKPTAPALRPVSAIHVLNSYQGESTKGSLAFLNSRSAKGAGGWSSLCSPLQKYPANDDSQYSIPIPFVKLPRYDPPPPVGDE